MTILQSLAAFYERLERRGKSKGTELVPQFGFKPVQIDFVLEIEADGQPLSLIRLNPTEPRGPKLMMPGIAYNPKPKKGETEWEDLSFSSRTFGRRSYVFWDKSSYVFGVTSKKQSTDAGQKVLPDVTDKSREDHQAFVIAHKKLLATSEEPMLKALLEFAERWRPEHWGQMAFSSDALDKNIAFRLKLAPIRIDEVDEARRLATGVASSSTSPAHCLVQGRTVPFAIKHPQLKGVMGAQSSGAALVSFNAEAFKSYGKEQGANAPVSVDAAFRYGAALNWLLDRSNTRAFRLGETTVVFWADEKEGNVGEASAHAAEEAFWGELGEPFERDVDAADAETIRTDLTNVRNLRAAPDIKALNPATRLHILGLSPNSGRIAVRFWLVDTYGHLEENLKRYKSEIAILPPGRHPAQKAYALLYETAVQGKKENIPPRLGGELARAILTGSPYPRTLFTSVIGRMRADKVVNAARAGICKAVINRDNDREVIPVALDPESNDQAYNLGRLFAVYEYAEQAVANRNATIRDKYIGAASATPRRVFPILVRGYEHNASALAKGEGNQRGSGIKAAKAVTQILERFGGQSLFPTALTLEEQGRFFVGYYHQNAALYTKTDRSAETRETEGAST